MGDATSLSLDFIHRRADARPLDDAAVANLADSIRDIGLITPVTVRQTGPNLFELIAGNHRFAACDGLGWRDIECRIVDDDDLTAELRMIDENLCRSELSPAESARQTARRKAIYEELHPETKHGASGNGRSKSCQSGNSAAERFVTNTANRTGLGERTVSRHAERGNRITDEALSAVSGSRLDKGVYLDRLARIEPTQQLATVQNDLKTAPKAGERRPYAHIGGKASKPASASPPTTPIKTETDPFAAWIDLCENAASLDAEAIFDACPVRQRPTLAQRCEAVRAILDEIADLIERPNVRRPAR